LQVGKKWAGLGYRALPKDNTVTLANARERRTSATPGNYAHMIEHCTKKQKKLIPFFLTDVQQKRSTNRRAASDKESAPSLSLLLDTGTIDKRLFLLPSLIRLEIKYKIYYSRYAS
jgi:hypothetical protein